MELGAGIGRFTGELAKKAGQLIALDFIESVIKKVTAVAKDNWLKKKMRFFFFFCGAYLSILFPILSLQNESTNGHYKNVKFLCADVTSPDLQFPEGSLDLIFSNWLLMYLSDKEVNNIGFTTCFNKDLVFLEFSGVKYITFLCLF